MNFPTIPYEDEKARKQIMAKFGIKSFPQIIMLGPLKKKTGERPLVNQEGCLNHSVKGSIQRGTYMEDFPFVPILHDVSWGTDDMNSKRSLVVFCEGASFQDKVTVVNAVEKVLRKRKNKPLPKIYYATKPGGIADAYLGILKIKDKLNDQGPLVVLLDMPDNGGYYLQTPTYTDFSADLLTQFIQDPGKRLQMTA
jgi:hypothetical protein